MNRVGIRSLVALGAIVASGRAARAVDPPDLRINGFTGLVETVDAAWSGTNYNVRYTVASGAGLQAGSILLTSNPANDVDPRIVLSATGDTYVVWWRDTTPTVVTYRKQTGFTGNWGAECMVGMASESNSRPRLAYGGDRVWVAYQIQGSKSKSVGVQIIDDDPEPVRHIVATTSYPGDLDVQIQAEAGQLWVSWIDTNSRVGYSQYIEGKGVWVAPAYESFAGDSIAAARSRIRQYVLCAVP